MTGSIILSLFPRGTDAQRSLLFSVGPLPYTLIPVRFSSSECRLSKHSQTGISNGKGCKRDGENF